MDTHQLADARQALTGEVTKELLGTFSRGILETLCHEKDCYPDGSCFDGLPLADLRTSLWVKFDHLKHIFQSNSKITG